MLNLWQDLRYAVRQLKKSPGFTAVAVLTLALGIGANTAIFSLIDAIILRQLPVAQPTQLVMLRRIFPDGHAGYAFSYPRFVQLRKTQPVFSGLLAWSYSDLNVRAGNSARRVSTDYVSGNYFQVLGIHPLRGRTLITGDDRSEAAPVAVISYVLWSDFLSKGTDVVGKTIYVQDVPVTVVGVMPREFTGLDVGKRTDVMVPTNLVSQIMPEGDHVLTDHAWNMWHLMGRLRPGVAPPQALASLSVLYTQLLAENGGTGSKERIDVEEGATGSSPYYSDLRGQYSRSLWILMVVAGLVLLIACANVANLLLARANSRGREFGIRLALGAARGRLIRQLLVENVLLAMVGGTLGMWLAYFGSCGLVRLLSTTQSRVFLDIHLDARILAFTAGVALLTVLFFGLVPALRGSRVTLSDSLQGTLRTTSNQGHARLNRLIVVGQVAISLSLVVGAGLFVRTLHSLRKVDPGFDPQRVVVFHVNWGRTRLEGAQLNNALREILDRVSALPGIRAASFSNFAPFGSGGWNMWVKVDGRQALQNPHFNAVTPGYFATFGTSVLLGRSFDAQDDATSARVIVVNRAFVSEIFPGVDPLGKQVLLGLQGDIPFEIVGVVPDAKYYSLREAAPPQVYLPYFRSWNPPEVLAFEVRLSAIGKSDSGRLIAAVQSELGPINKYATMTMTTIDAQLDDSLQQERLMTILSSGFGLLALALAGVGLYGLLSYTVNRRIKEIGIRMALGAQRGDVLWMVMRENLALVLIGVAIGVPSALLAIRLASSVIAEMLFGVRVTDPGTIVIAVAVTIGAALIAGYIPARRAAKVDPMVALRYE